MKKSHHLLLLFCIIFIALIASFVPGINQQIAENTKIDTIGHFIGFFILTWVLRSFLKLPMTVTAITLIFYAAATELGQAYLGFRNAEFADFIADIFGVGCFIFLSWFRLVFNKR